MRLGDLLRHRGVFGGGYGLKIAGWVKRGICLQIGLRLWYNLCERANAKNEKYSRGGSDTVRKKTCFLTLGRNDSMKQTWEALGIEQALITALKAQGIDTPTKIQAEMIPPFLQGKDLIGCAQTGSGKTLAYLLPLFQQVDPSLRSTQAIVLTPTHELAVQVQRQAELLTKNSGLPVSSVLIIGSAGIGRQIERLKEKPQIVIGSAGRVLDLIRRKKIQAHTVKTIVLDEGDRLLDEINREVVESVIRTTLRQRQLVLVSASVGEETVKRAREIMKRDALLLQAKQTAVPEQILHCYILAEERDKFVELRKILAGEKPKKAIVFLNNPTNIEVTADKLNHHGIGAAGIYGMASKLGRMQALNDFREGKIHVLVASDIGARGLDVPEVTHVINLDVPEDPTFYLHRAGRCGRLNAGGTVISIVTPQQRRWIHKYEKALGITCVQKEMSYGELRDSSRTKNDLRGRKKSAKSSAGTEKAQAEPKQKANGKKEPKQKTAKILPQKAKKQPLPPAQEKDEKPSGFFAQKIAKRKAKEENRQKNKKSSQK